MDPLAVIAITPVSGAGSPAALSSGPGTPPGAPGMPTNTDLSLYSSFTVRNGRNMLWYPDRKFFLLGKEVTGEFLADMRVPEPE